jgi:diacylglycerol kinase (ATP)
MLVADSGAQAELECHRAVADGVAAIVAVGGDGTVHQVLQAVAGTDVPLGVIPAGTGNDFARCLGLPDDLLAAADQVHLALDGGAYREIDLARLTTPDDAVRWFGAVLAAGFDAVVNERGNRMRWPAGARRYDLAIVLELLRLRPRRYAIALDGVRQELDAVLVAVGNTAAYGGGMRIAPDADPTDGLLDLVYAGPMSRGALMRIKPRIYDGGHLAHPAVHTVRAREIMINAADVVCYADGERISPLPVTITAVPAALRLLA